MKFILIDRFFLKKLFCNISNDLKKRVFFFNTDCSKRFSSIPVELVPYKLYKYSKRRFSCSQTVAVLLLNAFLTSLVSAQYGSPVNNGNPGYGGTGVPSGDYGHKASIPSASGSDGNSEVSPMAAYDQMHFVNYQGVQRRKIRVCR